MKILLTQQEWVRAPNGWIMDAVERAWYYLLHGHDIRAAPNTQDLFTGHPDWDCLILTGGPDSLARNATENLLMQICLDHDLPMIGVCHGALAINDYLGGINGHVDGHRDCDHHISMHDRRYLVNSYHSQCLQHLATGLIPLAHDDQNNVEAFGDEDRGIWGVMWHPERMCEPVWPAQIANILQIS